MISIQETVLCDTPASHLISRSKSFSFIWDHFVLLVTLFSWDEGHFLAVVRIQIWTYFSWRLLFSGLLLRVVWYNDTNVTNILDNCLALNMETSGSSGTLIHFPHISRRYIPKDSNPYSNRSQNLKSHTLPLVPEVFQAKALLYRRLQFRALVCVYDKFRKEYVITRDRIVMQKHIYFLQPKSMFIWIYIWITSFLKF
jgi:hypothetical protein